MSEYRREGEVMEAATPSFAGRALRWIVGWLVLPGLLLAALFAWGMHWGARNPESSWVGMTRWIAQELFSVDPERFGGELAKESQE